MSGFPKTAGGLPITSNDGTATYSITRTGVGSFTTATDDNASDAVADEQTSASSGVASRSLRAASAGNEARLVESVPFGADQAMIRMEVGGAGVVDVRRDNLARLRLGFYQAAPVLQAAHPVTLADVITLLTNLGLCQ